MYTEAMTIKRRLFISNMRLVFITIATMGFTGPTVTFLMFGRPGPDTIARFSEVNNYDTRRVVMIFAFAFFIILMSVINNFLTHRMTKRIIKPLEPLNEGVKQIQGNNFAHRIAYQNDDEFRPVCEAFNEMAAKLETSTAQQKKDEANRKELIAGISHDLRTPLTSIKGCIEGIKTGVASTPEMRDKYLSVIETKTANMEHIIEQLFLFSKLDMDEFPITMRNVDITYAVTEMIEDSISEYERRGLSIKISEMPKDLYVSVDVLMLHNVIINILENSVKYKTKEYGQMEVSASRMNGSVLLRFVDDGPGVHTDMLPKLFDVFYRTDPSRSKLGSGLGLAICEKIITAMGGSIFAEAPSRGGLAILINFPLSTEEKV